MDRSHSQRSAHSEERDNKMPTQAHQMPRYKTNTLPVGGSGRERCVSMPSGHYAATPGGSQSMTTPRKVSRRSPAANSLGAGSAANGKFQHYGSSLSLSNGSTSTTDLTSRTLRPPSPTTLKKSSIPGKPKYEPAVPAQSAQRPSLPSLSSVELESPKLSDYLEKPRLVSLPSKSLQTRLAASAAHAKRINSATAGGQYRNLRLGNFLESGESNEEELIPERLRLYYLDTFFNACDTCESKTHLDPTSPIQRGM